MNHELIVQTKPWRMRMNHKPYASLYPGIFFEQYKKKIMENSIQLSQDRVRMNTPDSINRKIDEKTENNIIEYAAMDAAAIRSRIEALDKEWDIERYLMLTSAVNVITGISLGMARNRNWFLLSAISAAFLIQHAFQGWCPPLPVFRKFGVRTKNEIFTERKALSEQLEQQED